MRKEGFSQKQFQPKNLIRKVGIQADILIDKKNDEML